VLIVRVNTTTIPTVWGEEDEKKRRECAGNHKRGETGEAKLKDQCRIII